MRAKLREPAHAVLLCTPAMLIGAFRRNPTGPAVAGRPLRSMSPGVGLRPPPPPLLTRKGLPATAGLGWR